MKIPFAVVLCSSLVAAQGVVSPIHFDMAEGPNGSTTPFGLTNSDDRHVQVHNDINTARTINRLMFRLDGSEPLNGNTSFTATVRLSRAASGVNAGNLNTVFANNHGTGLTTFASLNLNFPATTNPINPGRPFDRVITLPAPYAFAGGGPLCWEVEMSGRTTTQAAAFDSITSPGGVTAPPLAIVQPIGQGCKVNSGAAGPLRLDVSAVTDWATFGVRFTMTTTNALSVGTADNRVFVFFGFNRNTFRGLSLPWALPGTGGALGVCTLYTSVANFLLSGPVNRTTTASGLVTEMPLRPYLNGCEIFFQSMALAPDANLYGVALSNMVAAQVIAPFGQAPLGSVSGRGTGAAAAGTTAPFSGLITRFE